LVPGNWKEKKKNRNGGNVTTFEKLVLQHGMIIEIRVFEFPEEFSGGQFRKLILFLEIEHVESSARRALHPELDKLRFGLRQVGATRWISI
jgi:hypothetical protein